MVLTCSASAYIHAAIAIVHAARWLSSLQICNFDFLFAIMQYTWFQQEHAHAVCTIHSPTGWKNTLISLHRKDGW